MPSSVHPVPLHAGDALVIVDVQSDLLPGGRLAVPRGDEVVAVLNGCLAAFRKLGLPGVATRGRCAASWQVAEEPAAGRQGSWGSRIHVSIGSEGVHDFFDGSRAVEVLP